MGTFFKRLFTEWNKYQEDVKPAPVPPVPAPVPPIPPEPVPVPPAPVPQPMASNLVIWDGDKIPDQIRQAFPSVANFTDNQLFWTLFDVRSFGTHDGGFTPEVQVLADNAQAIGDWFRDRIKNITVQLKANSSLKVQPVQGDENDRGALYIIDNILFMLSGINSSQVLISHIYKGEGKWEDK